MRLKGKKVGILVESDFADYEIHYYQHRFPEEGMELHFLSRLWGQPGLTFKGHEYGSPLYVNETFENMSDDELRSYAAIIIPGGMVSDRLRYTDSVDKLPPATEFMKRAFAEPGVVKGINCHGMWLISLAPELVRGRRVVSHINLLGDNPLLGRNDDRLGPRFPDMSDPYDAALRARARAEAKRQGITLREGVYVAVTGPNLETRAEYRMLRALGADVVGMSTVPEVIVAVHGGMRVLGVSIITDMCLPDALEPASLEKIIAVAAKAEPHLTSLITGVVERL